MKSIRRPRAAFKDVKHKRHPLSNVPGTERESLQKQQEKRRTSSAQILTNPITSPTRCPRTTRGEVHQMQDCCMHTANTAAFLLVAQVQAHPEGGMWGRLGGKTQPQTQHWGCTPPLALSPTKGREAKPGRAQTGVTMAHTE